MKKNILAILLIIPAIWAGLTWFAANKTEEVFNAMLSVSNQNMAENMPMLKLEKQSFNKGFISSTATSILHINSELLDAEDIPEISLQHTIYHGPLMTTEDGIKMGTSYIITTLDQSSLKPQTQELIALIFAAEEPFISRTQTNFDGSMTEHFEMPTATIDSIEVAKILGEEPRSGEHFKLSLAGILAELNMDTKVSYLQGHVTTGDLILNINDNGENLTLTVKQSKALFDIDEIYAGAALQGSTTLELAELLINSAGQTISLKDIRVTASMQEQESTYQHLMNVDIAQLSMSGGKSIFILPDSKVQMSFATDGMDKAALKQFFELDQSMNQILLSGAVTANVEAEVQAYMNALSKLIKPGLASRNSIQLLNQQGSSTINFDINYGGIKTLEELKTLKELIIALTADLRININKQMFAGTVFASFLSSPMAAQAVQNNATSYDTIAILNNGELTLNGQAIPLLESLGSAIDEPLGF